MQLNKQFRILYHHRTRGDGAEGVHINEMIEAFRQLGHTVECCCPPAARRQPGLSMGMTGISESKSRGLAGRARIAVRQSLEIAYNAVSYLRVMRAITKFRPDVIYERYSCYHVAGARAASAKRIPFLLEVNSTYAGRFKRRQLAFPNFAARVEKRVLEQATVVATVSQPLKECVRDRDIWPDRIVVTPNAINEQAVLNLQLDSLSTRQRLGIPKDATVVGFVGSLRRWHGVDLLIDAIPQVLTRVPNAVFLIVGSGELEPELRVLLKDPKVANRLVLTGGVPHSQVYELIDCMDIGLMPHSNTWGSPMKILEYMALGKLCIAPRIGPIEEIVKDLTTGLLFTERDEVALTEAMIWACENPAPREQMGRRGRDYVMTSRRWIDNARIVLNAFETLEVDPALKRTDR